MQPCRNPRPPGQSDGEVACAEWSQEPNGHHHYCDGPKDHIGELHTCRCRTQFLTPTSRDDDIGKCPLTILALATATAIALWLGLHWWWP
ncbi:MAG TPA: hypothetical protein DGT23_19560 [Micromonosporaceae bacterium]|nr:hypothetical protein [Micromonosporaceae bacterium]